MKKIKILQIQR